MEQVITMESLTAEIRNLVVPSNICKVPIIYCPDCETIPLVTLISTLEIKIYCPLCKKTTNEKIANVINNNSKFTMKKEKFCFNNSHVKTRASLYCLTCGQFLCSNCISTFHKDYPNHFLLDVSIPIKNVCEKHSCPFHYYCGKTKREVCVECLKDHKSCENEHIVLETLIKDNFLDELADSLHRANSMINETNVKLKDDFLKKFKKDISTISTTFRSKTMEGIKNCRLQIEKINKHYQKYFSDLIKEMNDKVHTLSTSVERIQKSFEANRATNNLLMKLILMLASNYQVLQGKYDYESIMNVKNNTELNLYSIPESAQPEEVVNYFENYYISNKVNMHKKEITKLQIRQEITHSCPLNYSEVFTVFKSKDCLNLIVFGNDDKGIYFYDMDKDTAIHKIEEAHKDKIRSVRYFYDKNKENDLIISSGKDKFVKVWDFNNNYQCICEIDTQYKHEWLYGEIILFQGDKRYIVTSAFNCSLRVYDFEQNLIKDLGDESKGGHRYTDALYDNNKEYILTCGKPVLNSSVTVFDFKTYEVFQKYKGKQNAESWGAKLAEYDKKTVLIVSYWETGFIEIFNFRNGILMKSIKGDGKKLCDVCIWNEEYFLSGGDDGQIKVYNLNKSKFIGGVKGIDFKIRGLKKYNHPKYGHCVICIFDDYSIRLWS